MRFLFLLTLCTPVFSQDFLGIPSEKIVAVPEFSLGVVEGFTSSVVPVEGDLKKCFEDDAAIITKMGGVIENLLSGDRLRLTQAALELTIIIQKDIIDAQRDCKAVKLSPEDEKKMSHFADLTQDPLKMVRVVTLRSIAHGTEIAGFAKKARAALMAKKFRTAGSLVGMVGRSVVFEEQLEFDVAAIYKSLKSMGVLDAEALTLGVAQGFFSLAVEDSKILAPCFETVDPIAEKILNALKKISEGDHVAIVDGFYEIVHTIQVEAVPAFMECAHSKLSEADMLTLSTIFKEIAQPSMLFNVLSHNFEEDPHFAFQQMKAVELNFVNHDYRAAGAAFGAMIEYYVDPNAIKKMQMVVYTPSHSHDSLSVDPEMEDRIKKGLALVEGVVEGFFAGVQVKSSSLLKCDLDVDRLTQHTHECMAGMQAVNIMSEFQCVVSLVTGKILPTVRDCTHLEMPESHREQLFISLELLRHHPFEFACTAAKRILMNGMEVFREATTAISMLTSSQFKPAGIMIGRVVAIALDGLLQPTEAPTMLPDIELTQ